ncbi:MAG: sugar-binding domain-containing protein [Clostridiaceae bacterium]
MIKKENTLLYTRWGKALGKSETPHAEYPRPQFIRAQWLCLNGPWEYAIRRDDTAPEVYDGDILVPFSPESLLSGVRRALKPGDTLFYKRSFTYPAQGENTRTLLHFGAVDQVCEVFLNGAALGSHEGGYWPFSFDVTDALRGGENVLTLRVRDDSDLGTEAYGKQRIKRGGIWYTPQSGIWQTVWLETVPELHITALSIAPLYDEAAVELTLSFASDIPAVTRVAVLDGDAEAARAEFTGTSVRIPLPDFKSWSPESPFLYTLSIEAGEDRVQSYFGMRKFSAVRDEFGRARFALNGKPLFMSGLLDQGYWSDGMYTAPSDAAMAWELATLKGLGFNMLRKHIKVEPLRFYYHCDRLGMLVWQDFVSGGGPYDPFVIYALPRVGARLDDSNYARFGRENEKSRAAFERDARRTVELLKNAVSLAVWVPFNEGWGQFDAKRVAEAVKAMDPSRLVDHASGYYDQNAGDLAGPHVYFKPFRPKKDPLGRIQVLSEFGGYSLFTKGHTFSDKRFGYKLYKSARALSAAYERFYRSEILPAVKEGLCAAVYTQVSDVEDELNGVFTYDRAVMKLDMETVRRVNKELTDSL